MGHVRASQRSLYPATARNWTFKETEIKSIRKTPTCEKKVENSFNSAYSQFDSCFSNRIGSRWAAQVFTYYTDPAECDNALDSYAVI